MRLTVQRVIRIVLISFVVIFIVTNIHHIASTSNVSSPGQKSGKSSSSSQVDILHTASGISNMSVFARNQYSITSLDDPENQTQLKYHRSIPANDSMALKQEVVRINAEQLIHNLDKYPLNLSSEGLVIVIQVHDRPEYLQILLDSMRKVRDMEKSLLIISHDVYSNQLNEIVESVDFCPVMQIFYPFSQQIFKHEFPSEHPNDCPRDVKMEEALKMKCNNANHPDKYGHYREAKYCQAKHHWMWKLHHIFEGINVLKGYEGLIMLLEDDYYLSEDIIFSTHKLRALRERECPDCRMLVLGNYEKNQNYLINAAKAERAYWISSKHNMGMTFNRSLWLHIKNCAKEFCQFDDYNWDWTLQHLSMTCIPDKIKLLMMKATRIFHIGECGMHKKSENCDPKAKVKEAETKLKDNLQHLYPDAVSLAGDSRFKLRDMKPNGGWGDIRDHQLCEQYFNVTDR